jgi:hypothetical protein
MSFFERFTKKATEIGLQGTEEQQNAIASYAAFASNGLNKLGDQIAGRDRNNRHHRPGDLVHSVVDSISGVVHVLFEITRRDNT